MAEARVPAGDVAVLFGLPGSSTLCCTAGRPDRSVSQLLEPPRPTAEGEVHHLEAGVLHLQDDVHPQRPGGLHAEWPVA